MDFMDHEVEEEEVKDIEQQPAQEVSETSEMRDAPNIWKWVAIGFFGIFLFTRIFDVNISFKPEFGGRAFLGGSIVKNQNKDQKVGASDIEKAVLPKDGIALPIRWGNLGRQMADTGVIDSKKFEELYESRGGFNDEMRKMLYEDGNDTIVMTEDNAPYLLNLLWAFGLGNKNVVLERGPISDPQYGGAGGFAATGGWTLAEGNPMNHFNAHEFVRLSPDQQALVERVAKNIYRPCCGNSTYFPDCNHGMAMLGLLELMAANGVSEGDMYKVALQVNAYWFPDTYLTIAKVIQDGGGDWNAVDPKAILGAEYSSAQGFQRIRQKVAPEQPRGGGGCGA